MEFILLRIIDLLLTVLWLAILGRVIMPLFNVSRSNPLYVIVYRITEPILGPIRRLLPQMGAMDFSPLVVMILIVVVRRVLT